MALNAGVVFIDVLPNTAKFTPALQAQMATAGATAGKAASQSLSKSLQSAGKTMTATGKSLTKYVTLPVVAAGAASLKMAVDFETSFTRIRANSNLTEAQITKLRGSVLDLAGKTAQSPQELGDALYFLASAGLNAKQVTQTLEQAAKGSAAGFGDTADIARLTANALNAYAKSGLTATQVTDQLAAAVREGTAEPDEFASALGRILPVASKAGVSFDEVTASLASLSNIGLDVNEGVTAMRGVLSSLLSPGTQAKDTLKEFGLTADEVRKSIADDGILGAMRLLEEATNGDIDALRKIIPNIRALTGQFGLTGQKADKVSGAFDRVRNSTGDLDKAFGETKKSSAFQLQQLLADLQVTAIKLGTRALPVLRDVTKSVSDMLDSFNKLSPGTQSAIVKFGLLAAAAGPLLRIFGPLVGLVGKLGGGLGLLGGGAAGTAGIGAGAATAVAPVALLTGAVAAFVIAQKRATDASSAAEAEITKYGKHSEAAAKEVAQLENDARGLGKAALLSDARIEAATETHRHYTGVLVGNSEALRSFRGWLQNTEKLTDKQTVTLGNNVDALYKLGGALNRTQKQQISNLLAAGDYTGALKILQDDLDQTTRRHRNLDAGLSNTRDQVAANEGRTKAYTSALNDIPKEKNTKAGFDDSQARTKLSAWQKQLEAFPDTLAFRLEGRGDGPGIMVSGPAGTPTSMFNQLQQAVPGPQTISSGYRPGAITASGNRSLHGIPPPWNAVDVVGSNLLSFAKAAAASYGPHLRELIYTPLGYSIKDGVRTSPLAASDHWDHVHLAKYGYHGDVDKPTLFMAGEASRERVDITPYGQKSGGHSSPVYNVSVTINGPGLDRGWVRNEVGEGVEQGIRATERWSRARTRVG